LQEIDRLREENSNFKQQIEGKIPEMNNYQQ
jgi:hypothetical protein